jgi:hypothetical protein
MRARITVIVLIFLGVITLGLVIQYIVKLRTVSDRTACLNHFRELGQYASNYHTNIKDNPLAAVPPGTVVVNEFAVEDRLSWIVPSLPSLNQKRQNTMAIYGRFRLNEKWDSPANSDAANHRINVLSCPGALHENVSFTQIVGLAGVGHDAATLSLEPPVSNRAGCFRYDSPTPLSLIGENDGLSQTFLFAETSHELGPWSRGGRSTIRSLIVGEIAPKPLGTGGQFGGNYPDVTGFGLADGSARFFTDTTHPDLIRNMMTIAGKGYDSIPGE